VCTLFLTRYPGVLPATSSSFNWDEDPDKLKHFREEFESGFDDEWVDLNLLIGN